jgi:quaternary ammonium compound-resistance protein SugE
MSINAAWVLLFFSGLLEICWALSTKYTDGFTKLWPTVFCLLLSCFNVFLLALVVRTLPVGISYAVWVGIGAAGTLLASHYLFGDQIRAVQVFFIFMILAGIAGIKLS